MSPSAEPIHARNQSAYQYKELKEQGQIRVFDLEPGSFNAPLVCRIRHVRLESTRHEAISYVWGDANDTVPISCSGKILKIPRTLDVALRHFRRSKHPLLPRKLWFRTLWADSICINQKNDAEKSHQVRQMGRVYRKANQALMWQGPDTAGLKGILRAIEVKLGEFRRPENFEGVLRVLNQHRIVLWHQIPGVHKALYAALREFFSRGYFTRAWIVREVTMATNATLVYGYQSLPWNRLRSFVARRNDGARKLWHRLCWVVREHHSFDMTLVDSMLVFYTFLSGGFNPGKKTLYRLCQLMAPLKCRDPRDKIFAIVELASDADEAQHHGLIPDYSITYTHLLHRLAVYLNKRCIGPRALAQAPTIRWRLRTRECIQLAVDRPLRPKYPDLDFLLFYIEMRIPASPVNRSPTWIANEPGAHLFGLIYYSTVTSSSRGHPAKFDAGARALHQSLRFITASNNDNELSLQGWIVDTVKAEPSCFQHFPALENGTQAVARTGLFPPPCVSPQVSMQRWVLTGLGVTSLEGWEQRAECPQYQTLLARTLGQLGLELTLEEALADLQKCIGRLGRISLFHPAEATPTEDADLDWSHLEHFLFVMHLQYRTCRTESGRVGLAPNVATNGDCVIVIPGVEIPLVIRATGLGTYELIGECAFTGIMDGEVPKMPGIQLQEIVLV